MKRYWHVLKLFWATSIAAEMEYRANFGFAAVSSVAHLASNFFALFLFYRVGYEMGGWSWDQAMIVLGAFTLLQGYTASFLTPNLSRMVYHVQQGTLDFVLLKPIDAQFQLSMRNFSPWGLTDMLLGLLLILIAGIRLKLSLSAYALGAIPMLSGLIVLYGLWFLLSTTTVWFVKIYNVTEVLRALLEAGRFPVVAYPAGFRFFFTFIIPVAFMTTVPAQLMLDRADATWLWGGIALAAGLLALSRWFWFFAIRFYTSASS